MSDSELWSVALAANNIQTMTLDQLDEAFQRGVIQESTLIWTEGMDNWEKLGEVLGDDEEPAAPTAPAVAHQAVAHQAVAQQAAAQQAAAQQMAAQQMAAQQQQRVAPQQVSVAPQAAVRVAPVAAFPPVTRAPSPTSAPNSLAPVASAPFPMGLGGDDLDLDGFGAKKKGKWGYFAAAAVVLGGVGFTAANLTSKGVPHVDPGKAAAAAMPIPAAEDQLAGTTVNSPDAPLAGGGYQVSAAEEKKFKDETEAEAEQRKKMAAALAGKPEPAPKKTSGASHKAQRPQRQKSDDTGISSSGAKFDPLNGSLP